MPYTSRYHKARPKRFAKKSRFHKRKSLRNTKTTTVVKSAGPFAPKTICRLKYTDTLRASNSAFDQTYRLNSLFDPDYTHGGHQPMGRDQYALLYNKYRVFACHYRIKAMTNDAGTILIGVIANNTLTAFEDTTFKEQKGCSVKMIQQGCPATFTGRVYLPKINGVTRETYASDDRFAAEQDANPAESFGLHICCFDASDFVPATAAVWYQVTLIYHVEQFDPNNLPVS